MPLNPQVKVEVLQKLELYEGRVPHFYLDTVGRVTIGVGHLVTNRNAVGSLVMYHMANNVPGAIATLPEKQTEYDRVAKSTKGMRASWYKAKVPTTLMMKDADINTLRDKHLDSFYAELTNIYRKSKGYPEDFDSLPRNVQIALFDMIFNLGASKIVSVFVNFNLAIKAGDWKAAAEQSNRPQVSGERNQYVRSLFLSAVPALPPRP